MTKEEVLKLNHRDEVFVRGYVVKREGQPRLPGGPGARVLVEFTGCSPISIGHELIVNKHRDAIKAGDTVMTHDGRRAQVFATDGEFAWLKFPESGSRLEYIVYIT